MAKWIEDWFGSKYYCLLYKHRGHDEAKFFLDNLIAKLNFPKNAAMLDCGCGNGRHSFYLNDKGFDVTGIDISEQRILESKKREGHNLTFFTHDMRNLFRINYYDVALSLFTSFGYFDIDSENEKVIKSTASALKQNGLFILDFMNAEKEAQNLMPEEKKEIDGIAFKVNRFTKKNCITKEITITDQDKEFYFRENVKGYNREDLVNLFTRNNLEIVHLFGDYALNPFNQISSDRLIIIGKKK